MNTYFRFVFNSVFFFRALPFCAAFGSTASAQGLFTYPGCADVAESQFRYQTVVGRNSATNPLLVDATLLEPLKLAFDALPDGSQDIYIAQRRGEVRKYNTRTNTIVTVGTVPVSTSGEWGLTGIALDPNVRTNHWVYVYYAAGSPNSFRLSRVTLNAAHSQFLNNSFASSERRLITIGAASGIVHTGSGLAFDAYGDLWIPVGKNATDYSNSYSETDSTRSTENTSSNGASLKGGILRIHPNDAAPKGYTIPAGNYGEHFAHYFRSKGTAADSLLAAQYADTSKVKPEIYVKGARNAYSITVDPVKRWLTWGEFGVNTTNTWTEEHNLTAKPMFGGYPYFAGGGNGHPVFPLWNNTQNYNGQAVFQAAHPGGTETVEAPVNNSVWNKGPKQLPPATPGFHTYMHTLNTAATNGGGAVTGPIYRYDGVSASTIKFPPHFHGTWFVTDYIQEAANHIGIHGYKLNDSGTAVLDSVIWFKNYGINYPLDLQQGPDGALYIVNYGATRYGSDNNTSIARIEYTGACRPATASLNGRHMPVLNASLTGRGLQVNAGDFLLTVRDVAGREWSRFSGKGPRAYALTELAPGAHGVLIVTVAGARGKQTFRLYKD